MLFKETLITVTSVSLDSIVPSPTSHPHSPFLFPGINQITVFTPLRFLTVSLAIIMFHEYTRTKGTSHYNLFPIPSSVTIDVIPFHIYLDIFFHYMTIIFNPQTPILRSSLLILLLLLFLLDFLLLCLGCRSRRYIIGFCYYFVLIFILLGMDQSSLS